MKVDDRLHRINSQISLKCIGLRQQLDLNELKDLNKELSDIIKLVRQKEEDIQKFKERMRETMKNGNVNIMTTSRIEGLMSHYL